jgi:DNA replication and repair protein RecF
MRFNRIAITNVRNIERADLSLCPGLNHFHGSNGAGKTAVLEAVHILCRGRSFRSPLVRDIITRGADSLLVRGEWHDAQQGDRSVAIRRSLTSGTELRVDTQKVSRTSEVAQLTPLQTLLPDVAELVFGGPKQRRNWLDWGMFHVKPGYLPVLRDFLRVLKQRNASLRSPNTDATSASAWDHELSVLSEQIDSYRQEYLEELHPHVLTVLAALIPELTLTFEYRRGWPSGEAIEKLLGERGPREVKYGITQWGPHRADIRFKVEDREAAKVLSRGQGKLLATSLKVAQVALLNELHGKASLFLIDDVGAELDQEHCTMFFRLLRSQGSQIISTSVQNLRGGEFGFSPQDTATFHVKHGAVTKE